MLSPIVYANASLLDHRAMIQIAMSRVIADVTASRALDEAMPAPLRTSQPPRRARRGVVLPFRRAIVPATMTCPAAPDAAPDHADHAALILAVARRQDRAAFAVLFGYFAPRVKAWMMRAGTTPTAAEELAQETLLTVWRKAALFDPALAGASTWIFTIARNLRLDLVRRECHPSDLLPPEVGVAEEAPPADRAYDQQEREVRIRAALADLPPEQAQVIRKAFFEDKAHGEIEQELGIPLGTVKSRLRLAMNRLRAALGDVR